MKQKLIYSQSKRRPPPIRPPDLPERRLPKETTHSPRRHLALQHPILLTMGRPPPLWLPIRPTLLQRHDSRRHRRHHSPRIIPAQYIGYPEPRETRHRRAWHPNRFRALAVRRTPRILRLRSILLSVFRAQPHQARASQTDPEITRHRGKVWRYPDYPLRIHEELLRVV